MFLSYAIKCYHWAFNFFTTRIIVKILYELHNDCHSSYYFLTNVQIVRRTKFLIKILLITYILYTGWSTEHARPGFSSMTQLFKILFFWNLYKHTYSKTTIFSNTWDFLYYLLEDLFIACGYTNFCFSTENLPFRL